MENKHSLVSPFLKYWRDITFRYVNDQKKGGFKMSFPVIKKASYILVNTPDMIIHNGTTQTLE
ncbi:MAG: Betaine reductase, partial [Clostridia bacterium]|nr:Betaine reductase [Clostridia bacterium]